MTKHTIAFIGLGLIGGSIARGIKREQPDTCIMAYMRTQSKLLAAKEEGIIDLILPGIGEELRRCDMIFLCTPVAYNATYLSMIRPFLKDGAILTDVGSTKVNIHREVEALGLAGSFIGGHPMAGSEKTGFEHSTDRLLENAYYILTPTSQTSPQALATMEELARSIGAIPCILDYRHHDNIVAAISHLPHIVASSLVNLVQLQDDENENMKKLAAGGFKDITRIASASPDMWEQICMANAEPISLFLKQYIQSLEQILSRLSAGDNQAVYQLFDSSRTYRNSISEKVKGSVIPDYSFTVDVADEVGAISTLAVILSAKGISIQNIGINHNREHGEGALRISFYSEQARDQAWSQLEKYKYTLIKS